MLIYRNFLRIIKSPKNCSIFHNSEKHSIIMTTNTFIMNIDWNYSHTSDISWLFSTFLRVVLVIKFIVKIGLSLKNLYHGSELEKSGLNLLIIIYHSIWFRADSWTSNLKYYYKKKFFTVLLNFYLKDEDISKYYQLKKSSILNNSTLNLKNYKPKSESTIVYTKNSQIRICR